MQLLNTPYFLASRVYVIQLHFPLLSQSALKRSLEWVNECIRSHKLDFFPSRIPIQQLCLNSWSSHIVCKELMNVWQIKECIKRLARLGVEQIIIEEYEVGKIDVAVVVVCADVHAIAHPCCGTSNLTSPLMKTI